MGIRNKVTKDGFIETNVAGDTGLFGFEQQTITTSGSAVAITTGLTVLSGAFVTASLPVFSTTVATDGTVNNGILCLIVPASNDTFLLTASAPINGSAWTRVVDASSLGHILTAVGATGIAGPSAQFATGWFVSSGTIA